jgi:hypothetical protein
MSMTPNTSRDQGSPEEPAATAGVQSLGPVRRFQ